MGEITQTDIDRAVQYVYWHLARPKFAATALERLQRSQFDVGFSAAQLQTILATAQQQLVDVAKLNLLVQQWRDSTNAVTT